MSASDSTLASWLIQSIYAGISKVQPDDCRISGKFPFSGELGYHTKRSKVFFAMLSVLLNQDINPSNVDKITGVEMEDLLLIVRLLKSSRDPSFIPRPVRYILDFSEQAIQGHIGSQARPSFGNSVFANPILNPMFGVERTSSASSTPSFGGPMFGVERTSSASSTPSFGNKGTSEASSTPSFGGPSFGGNKRTSEARSASSGGKPKRRRIN